MTTITPAQSTGDSSPAKAVTYQYPRHRRNVAHARDALRRQLALWRVNGEVADTAVLLLSELATNAICAKTTPGREILVRFELKGPELRLEVSDASDEKPLPREAGPEEESGRGLALVTALADSWGVAPRLGVGKTVWACLLLAEAATP
ncbi:ATP-binding protein [Streptomyces sp. NA04227]|uniref:ATP-binding protein n=1 Tax=Streptomyces sp. NA04227 TaxID=2742136 RepID=UPI00159129E8|nr:ATP-binding protein [Streptomyces sp. NA04227]QKW08308.1 ATP-binding protein [Streptomyces sp. NA04227]